MDLDGIIRYIPSTEKILGISWIVCWILAIWAYPLQFFLTGLFCLFLVAVLTTKSDKKGDKEGSTKQPIIFSMDKSTKTLTVQKIYEESLKWDEYEICSGQAVLPSGFVNKNDVVKDCKGNVALRHVPSNTLVGGFNFED